MKRISFLLLAITVSAHAELWINTDFEGGNAEVVSLDSASRTLRIMPALREGRGWPCWWSLQLAGVSVGQEITLEVQAQTKPYRGNTVLAASWCQPKHAWISVDGVNWTPSPPGKIRPDKVMVYNIPASSAQLAIAWGPPFLPSDADKLLATIAARLPEAKRFELAKTRGGRSVPGIRIGREDATHQVWVGARQHAWEAGSSHVGRGFLNWYASNEAAGLRSKTCLYFIPIMDVDNVALGAGGKDATPRDHNRDWAAEPVYPEVAGAQRMIREIQARRGLDVFIDLHNPTYDNPIFFFGPFGFDALSESQQRNYQRWIDRAAVNMTAPFQVQPKYRFANYVKTDEERGRMSSGWVRANAAPFTISVTLETSWNSPRMSVDGYGQVGAGLGRTLAEYLQVDPRAVTSPSSTPR